MEESLGERRIRVKFGTQDDSVVQGIKERAAELIDYINSDAVAKQVGLPGENSGEFIRLRSLAFTAIEEGAMWAVKAATSKKK